ncbi:hypothetical protein BpHYR1_030168 [Brachionus plicatilis]|uniref:Uncharacterized protein n=1 Tax=Brachionus plicatilis TaxID=10195 RepID=A0A3M7RG63_BRAPC|nr:hypothetical protein BpHYR1_030168 [Brachionus plicatilis]
MATAVIQDNTVSSSSRDNTCRLDSRCTIVTNKTTEIIFFLFHCSEVKNDKINFSMDINLHVLVHFPVKNDPIMKISQETVFDIKYEYSSYLIKGFMTRIIRKKGATKNFVQFVFEIHKSI